ncbi:PREDICTED: tripartite motif-containing protein 16-like [Cyprinodon variegatus]|uniref:tripartite motif-containing protein 16-like n=1 Tax=Cyprinodon variegatus TaxID=28743 RepID=UPI00074267F8|nr:PREDICTED: tripartite motif-containing protein 16-like [Cyprinodon variegatus]
MAQRGDQLGKISCSICLDLLKDPVTIPCGHSFCMKCINVCWDGEEKKRIYSCPVCRKEFMSRPVLEKNVTLSALVEDMKKAGFQADPADPCYAGPEDVACDVCTGRKRKALKSCLVCLVSYCEKHLQPHYEFPVFEKHKLVEPSKKLRENICSRHNEVMKIYCRTDRQCICYLCSLDEHQGHDTVSAAAERTERQEELQVKRQQIQQKIQDQEKDLKLLQQEVEAINHSADKTREDSEEIFTELIRSSDVKQWIRSEQEAEVSRVKELQEKLEQEISALKKKDAELQQLSNMEDLNQFLYNYPPLPDLTESEDSSSINIRPPYFTYVRSAVSELRDVLQDILKYSWTNVSPTVSEVHVLESEKEPELKSRAGFLNHFQQITLDPNTANRNLLVSEGNRKVTLMKQQLFYPDHPERFKNYKQVLSRQSLTGRCYWEVERSERGAVHVAVSYKDPRKARGFGFNNRSWSLLCHTKSYMFYHNNIHTPVSGPISSRIGVYLDHIAGVLSFYSISETMTTFTQPLHAGIWILNYGSSAEFIQLK